MKHKIRLIWLAICVALCAASVSACGARQVEDDSIDPAIVMSIQDGSSQYLDLFASLEDDEIDEMIAAVEENGDSVMSGALNSWKNVKGDLGALVSYQTATVEKTDDGYMARIDAQFEQRKCEFTLSVDKDVSHVTSISFNPEYTLMEKMGKAAMNTVLGMGIVFAVLIFISFIISRFKYINEYEKKFREKKAQKAKEAEAAAAQAAEPAPAPAEPPAAVAATMGSGAPAYAEAEGEEADETELVAVIAAAIAACEGNVPPDELIVRSIKRVPRRGL